MGDPKNPKRDDLVIDASELEDFLEDLPDGSKVGKQTEGEGLPEVMQEIFENQEVYGKRAGISDERIVRLKKLNEQIQKIDKFLPTIKKLHEKMDETRHKLVHEREKEVSFVVKQVRLSASEPENQDLQARYEKSDGYVGASARKGNETRKRNKKVE